MTKLKKQFKAESKKLLDMMINSIYTNKEIFLRELISNASDAIDKLYYRSLTDKKVSVDKDELEIRIKIDKDNRTLTISDNGIGMSEEELETNLGTIAKSGSELFKQNNDKQKDIDIIGQFGVGFYSSFMVSDKVVVNSKSIDDKKSYTWTSEGASGYIIEEGNKKDNGTDIILYLKESDDDNSYEEFLEEYNIERLIKKYSDYIHYPIKMLVERTEKKDDKEEKVSEDKTLNSMIPIWKKSEKEVKEEEYNDFYTDKFYDYEKPLKVIRSSVEGRCSYAS
jgi:molecular chaperone HtpG